MWLGTLDRIHTWCSSLMATDVRFAKLSLSAYADNFYKKCWSVLFPVTILKLDTMGNVLSSKMIGICTFGMHREMAMIVKITNIRVENVIIDSSWPSLSAAMDSDMKISWSDVYKDAVYLSCRHDRNLNQCLQCCVGVLSVVKTQKYGNHNCQKI